VNTGRAAQVEITPGSPADEEIAQAPQQKVSLGMSADPVKLGTRSALKVTRVETGGAAAKAGIEVGDLIVAANGVSITGPDQLISVLRKSGATLTLTVRDSRTNRDIDVEVALPGARASKPLPTGVEAPSTTTNNVNLGAVVELAFHDNEFAVKVTEVDTDSPASRAGLLPGTLILAANGKPILHPNDVSDAVRNAKGSLKLTIVDPLTSEKGELNVNLAK
jgi:S1-C subfamily serine protease